MKNLIIYQSWMLVSSLVLLITTNTAVAQSSGILYGMTSGGGSSGEGVIFSYTIATGEYATLHDFDETHGSNPEGSLYEANDGLLYGMTYSGGFYSGGVLFSFNPATKEYRVLVNFDPRVEGTGGEPVGDVIQASDGLIYGMTSLGGYYQVQDGVLFSYNPTTQDFRVPIEFGHDVNASNPTGTLTEASNGLLYGMTPSGGVANEGTLFSYNLQTQLATVVTDFNTFDGSYPAGSLYYASNGLLYGMTYNGGTDDYGIIFSFDPVTNSQTTLYDFDGTYGANPVSDLIELPSGLLYGMTKYGGPFGDGGLFYFNPTTLVETFGYFEGGQSSGHLLQGSDGLLYALVTTGGANGFGLIFSFNPTTEAFSILHSFNSSDGAFPDGSLIELKTVTGIHEVTNDHLVSVFPNPATSTVHVQSSVDKDAVFVLSDVLGTVILQKSVLHSKQAVAIDVSSLPQGMYTWEMKDGNTILESGKIGIVR